MKFLANVCEPHGINIIDKLYQEFGACPFNYILSSIVSLLIIQVVLANFLSLPSVNSSVNLQEIFGKVHADSKFMVNIIGNSRAYKTKLSKVECYSNALAAGERGIEIAARLMDSNSNQETLRELVGYYESGMGDFLTEYIFIKQFGSADGFARYVEKVWEFFIYLTLERQVTVGQQGEETGASDEDKILITRNIELNDDLINKWKEKFCGFEISRDIIDEYMIYVAGPHLQL